MEISLEECETLSYVLLLGCDLTEEFPVIWLRLRSALRQGASLSFCGYFAPEISPYLSDILLHRPGEELAIWEKEKKKCKEAILKGGKGAIFVGSQYLFQPNRRALLSALFEFQQQEGKNFSLNIMEGHRNSMGARFSGMHPELAPWGRKADKQGLDAGALLHHTQTNGWGLLYVVGENPALKFPSALWRKAREKIAFLAVQELFLTETAQEADLVLPVLSVWERSGSFMNIEGRVQSIKKGMAGEEGLLSDLEIFHELMHRLAVAKEPALSLPQTPFLFERPSHLCPQKQKILKELQQTGVQPGLEAPAGQQEEQFAVAFAPALFDGGRVLKESEHLKKLVRSPKARLAPQEASALGLQEGDCLFLQAKESVIEAQLSIDPAVAPGVIVLPIGFESHLPAQEFFGDRQREPLFVSLKTSIRS